MHISRIHKHNKITWRRQKRRHAGSPVLRKILMAILLLELAFFTWTQRRGALPVIIYGYEETVEWQNPEVEGRIYINIYYE